MEPGRVEATKHATKGTTSEAKHAPVSPTEQPPGEVNLLREFEEQVKEIKDLRVQCLI